MIKAIIRVIFNWRYYVLTATALAGIYLLLCAPGEDLDQQLWCYVMVSSKLLGAGLLYVVGRLFDYWEAQGTIPELTQVCEIMQPSAEELAEQEDNDDPYEI